MDDVTVFINNFNLVEWPSRLADRLARLGSVLIVFIDNGSTYPELLEYYESCNYEIVRLKTNLGHRAPWRSGAVERLSGDYYVVTDPDLDIDLVPDDMIERLRYGLDKFQAGKSGLSLELEDIPLHHPNHDEIVNWERQFWQQKADEQFFHAPVDTTFALYRRGWEGRPIQLRADRPYSARHLPWYVDLQEPPRDFIYYLKTASSVSTWGTKIRNALEKIGAEMSVRYATFTFDDGDIVTAREAADALVPDKATFYVVTGWVGPDQHRIREIIQDPVNRKIDHGDVDDWAALCNEGHDIGSHTVSHVPASDPRAPDEYMESLNFLRKLHEGPYSLAMPWHEAAEVAAPYDSIRCALGKKWNSVFDVDLHAVSSWTVFEHEREEALRELKDAPAGSWVVFCFHGFNGRSCAPWSLTAFREFLGSVREQGWWIRSMVEMTVFLRSDWVERCRVETGDKDDLTRARLYGVDYHDRENPATPVTPDQKAIVEHLLEQNLRGQRILHIGVGASDVALRLRETGAVVHGVTISRREKEFAGGLGIEGYEVWVCDKHGRRIRDLGEGVYDVIIDNNISSFAPCATCVYAVLENYKHLMKPDGLILSHKTGLNWAANLYIPGAKAYSIAELQTVCERLHMRVFELGRGVFAVENDIGPQRMGNSNEKKRNAWFVDYQEIPSKGVRGYRGFAARTALFMRQDFEGATVLDVGCNVGQMSFAACDWGASSIVAIDYDREAIRKARALLDNEPIVFECQDVDSPLCWRAQPVFDVVLLLSVYLTKELQHREAVLVSAANKARRVLYLETHEREAGGYGIREYVRDILLFTDFENVEVLGEIPGQGGRILIRASRGAFGWGEGLAKLSDLSRADGVQKVVVVGKSAVGKTTAAANLQHLGADGFVLVDDQPPPYSGEKIILFDWRGLEYVQDPDVLCFLTCSENERLRRIREDAPFKDELLRTPPGEVSASRAVITIRSE